MRWWGWGAPEHIPSLGSSTLDFLAQRIGISPSAQAPVALANVKLPALTLSPEVHGSLRKILGDGAVRSDHAQRVVHAAGRGYPDLVRLRAGEPQGAPDAVLYPASEAQLGEVLRVCQESSVAVVPFGGGTSVVGGVEPLKGDHRAVVALDVGALKDSPNIDHESLTVTAGAGIRVAELEQYLSLRGLTLGHFPQSFEYVSLGGCAATRSAGQASSGYGRFADMIEGLSMVSPTGTLKLGAFPSTAAGPDLREIAVGSEGVLGVISGLTLRIRAKPELEVHEGVFFSDFQSGCRALRQLAQGGCAPAIVRLSDEQETQMSLRLAAASGGTKQRLGGVYLNLRGYSEGCLAIVGFHGSSGEIDLQRQRLREITRADGGLAIGRSAGEAWAAQRFSAPYLRDELLTHGVMVETLETSTHWSNLIRLHEEVSAAISRELQAMGTPGIVMCHVSHLYETGASLYFTFLARQCQGREIEQWRTVKHAASDAIVASGGTITHHHAVGVDHAPWLGQEIGVRGIQALRALKSELDPAGIMNPGKLIG